MSILYRAIQKSNPQNKDAAPKYYAEVVMRGSVSFDEFLDAVCADTTLNRDEVRMAFNKGFKTILQFTKLGFNVHFGFVGLYESDSTQQGRGYSRRSNRRHHFRHRSALRL